MIYIFYRGRGALEERNIGMVEHWHSGALAGWSMGGGGQHWENRALEG